MTKLSPSAFDASTSRIYLTRTNHRGPRLLKTIRGIKTTSTNESEERSDAAPPSQPLETMPAKAKVQKTKKKQVQEQQQEQEQEEDDDVMREPESSDDDERLHDDDAGVGQSIEDNDGVLGIPPSPKRKRQDEEDTSPVNKRGKKGKVANRTSKRRRASPEADLEVEPEVQPEVETKAESVAPSMSQSSFPDSFSQSSQNKVRRAHYGKGNMTGPEDKKQKSMSRTTEAARLSVPPEVSTSANGTPKKTTSKKMMLVDEWKSPKRKSARNKRLEQPPPLPTDGDQKNKPKKSFEMPDESGLDIKSSSTNSLDTDLPIVLDLGDSPSSSKKKTRRDSASLSSDLSDLDSIVSVELSQSQKDDLKQGIDSSQKLPPHHVRCPVCDSAVDILIIRTKNNRDPSRLSVSQQRDFHYRHQFHDAKTLWKEKSYPTINWHALRAERIQSHTLYIRKILYRKQSSHYLTLLEKAIKSSRGNKTKLKKYLTEDLVDVFKQGYYGPRGAKIMAQVLTETLGKAIKTQMKADETIMTAGVSGYISAVLLPELCVRLVMEDFGLDDGGGGGREKGEKEARRIMDESTMAGVLLCPDDDHVERKDDE